MTINQIILKSLKEAYRKIKKSGEEIDGTNVWEEELKSIRNSIDYMEQEK